MVTLIIFIPVLTACLALLIPGKTLMKGVCLLGAIVTFALSSALWLGYGEEGNGNAADKMAALAKERMDEVPAEHRALVTSISDRDGGSSWISPQEELDLKSKGVFEHARDIRDFKLAQGVALAKGLEYIEYAPWISAFRINYFVGVDGLSIPLIWLTSLLGVLCLIYSWNIEKATKGYFTLFLMLITGLNGVFAALDFFLFYVFWEIVLLPMYFLIGIWGGPRRIYAALKFFIYTLVGSVLMLLAMLALYFNTDPYSFNLLTLMEVAPGFELTFQMYIFFALFIGFAIKVPVFPFHTWLPDAHVEAPTAASVVLAGVLLKMGGYGFFRFMYPLAPEAGTTKVCIMFIAILGVINIVYGALCALAQKDFKRLVAYSSISHMGYVLLGMAAMTSGGVNGAVLQMFNHGISSAMMFLLVGVVYDRAHHRDLNRFGGLGLQMPYYTGLATVGFFASLGLPALNGFISEALVFLGAYETELFPKVLVYISASGIVLTAGYILWTIQRVFFGSLNEKYRSFPDLNLREVLVLVPLGIMCIVYGVWPKFILDMLGGSIEIFLQMMPDSIRMAAGG